MILGLGINAAELIAGCQQAQCYQDNVARSAWQVATNPEQ